MQGVCVATTQECFTHAAAYQTYSYTGVTYKIDENGEYVLIPVTECEFGCAYGGLCGDESTCMTGKIIGWVFLGIFGFCFCACACVFLVAFCKAAKNIKSTSTVEYRRM